MLQLRRHLRPRLLLCADFDETITQHDTISLLFQLSGSSSWTQQQLITQYESESSAFLKGYATKWRRSNRNPFDDAGLRKFLEGYAAVDLHSLQRVVSSRALKSIHLQDIVDVASTVAIRADCVETLGKADEWKVLSANWSQELVALVLKGAGMEVQSTHIISNALKVDQRGVSTGDIGVKVQAPVDKERWIAEMKEEKMVVYIGDSASDLLALLEADVGVWLKADTAPSSSKLLQRLVETYGIDVHPLTKYESLADCKDAASTTKRGAEGRPVLFTTTDWSHVRTLVEVQGQNGRI